MSDNSSSNTFFFNNIFVNLGESTFDLNTNFFQQANQSEDCSSVFNSNTVSDPINIPSSSDNSCYFYDQQQQQQNHLQPSVSSYTNQNHHFLYSPISTSDDNSCFSPAADSDFLSASASSPASSSLGSYMANEAFMTSSTVNENINSNYFNQDFCLNDSLVGSQQLNNAQAFTIPAVQVQTEEEYPFFPTPVPTVPASPSSLSSSSISSFIKYEQDFTFMTSSPSPDSMMINHQHQQYEQQQQQQQQQYNPTTTTERRTSTRRRTPKIHQCPHCPHTSNRANNMKEHILTHDPNRPKKFPCPKCGKRFARKHDMRRHSKSPHH